MEIVISLNKEQRRTIERRFGKLKNLAWLRRPIRDSMWLMVESIDKNFKEEGRPEKWQAWTPGYRRAVREPIGPPYQILQLAGTLKSRTGRRRVFGLALKRSINVGRNLQENGWFIGTNLAYARIHQLGGVTGRFRNIRIPARPFMMFQEEDIGVIANMFRAHISLCLLGRGSA